ncbi:MAG: glycosyltransferase family 4 protein [Acidobacteriaceae bacterium]|nr:glycosyltransferase family 4 protein [Acidobacteriaceae bacterium]
MRLAIVTSHPIQYQAPWFRALAAQIDLEIFFCHRQDDKGQADAGYGTAFEWDVPLLDGYRHTWLKNVSRQPNVFSFRGCDTPEIGTRLAEGRFDACILNGWYLKSHLQAILACRRLGLPVFIRGDSQRATDRPLLLRALKYPFYRTLLNSVTGHLYVGEANRQYLLHYGVPSSRLWFVPHSVDDRRFREAAAFARQHGKTDEIRRRLSLPPDARIALFVGRLVAKKRPEDFIRALAHLSTTHVVGVIVGSGPLQPDLERLATECGVPVTFAGFANQSELPAYYAAAHILVLPSDSGETWGLVANEALACGTPIVVSDQTGCSRDLIEPDTGKIFPCGDIHALSRAITAMVDERAAHPDAVQRATASMSARYGSQAAADATITALRQSLTL